MSEYSTSGSRDDDASIRRAADGKAWICNIPDCDVAVGVEAAVSLRFLKRYVEETVERLSGPMAGPGRWERHADYADGTGSAAYRYYADWPDT